MTEHEDSVLSGETPARTGLGCTEDNKTTQFNTMEPLN